MTYTSGYALIKVGNANIPNFQKRVSELSDVKLCHSIFGPDDLICFICSKDPIQFQKSLDKEIREKAGEKANIVTETLLVFSKTAQNFPKGIEMPAPAAAWCLASISEEYPDPDTVALELKRKDHIVNAHPVLGQCTLIIYLEANDDQELYRALDIEVRQHPKIKKTDTRIVSMPCDHRTSNKIPRELNHLEYIGHDVGW